MLEIEYKESSSATSAGWVHHPVIEWLNVYEDGKAILAIRIVNGKTEVYRFDQVEDVTVLKEMMEKSLQDQGGE